MEIRLRNSGQVMLEVELRAYQKSIGGPSWNQTTQEVLELLEADIVFPAPPPTFNPVTQMVRKIQPELTAKGHWEQRWEVVSKFSEYVDDSGTVHTVAEQEAAAIAADREQQALALKNLIVSATQDRLDNFAKTRRYDGILSLCTYATSTVPKFQQEGQYGVNLRDQTWATLYQILDEVQQGTRPVPQSFADIEPLLPVPTWPN